MLSALPKSPRRTGQRVESLQSDVRVVGPANGCTAEQESPATANKKPLHRSSPADLVVLEKVPVRFQSRDQSENASTGGARSGDT